MIERRRRADRRRVLRGGRRTSDFAGRAFVLLAADHDGTCDLVGAVLESSGIPVDEAASCDETLRRLAVAPTPAAILLDLALPGCDTPDLIRRIRSNPSTASIPVVVLGPAAEERDHKAALDGGPARFVSKPVAPDDLLAAVREFVASS
jgi:CheY-like chemotaxis protein